MTKHNALKIDWANGTRYHVCKHLDDMETTHVDGKMTDERGRTIGFRCTITPATPTPAEEHTSNTYRFTRKSLPETIYYAVSNATRDRADFGASQSGKWFVDKADAVAYLAERVKTGLARYQRKYAN